MREWCRSTHGIGQGGGSCAELLQSPSKVHTLNMTKPPCQRGDPGGTAGTGVWTRRAQSSAEGRARHQRAVCAPPPRHLLRRARHAPWGVPGFDLARHGVSLLSCSWPPHRALSIFYYPALLLSPWTPRARHRHRGPWMMCPWLPGCSRVCSARRRRPPRGSPGCGGEQHLPFQALHREPRRLLLPSGGILPLSHSPASALLTPSATGTARASTAWAVHAPRATVPACTCGSASRAAARLL